MDTPRRRSLILVIAALCLGGVILIAVLVGRDTTTVPPDLASSQTKHHHPQRAPGMKVCEKGPRNSTLPAALLGRHVDPPGIHTDVLVTANAWSTGDCHTETWIYAGTAGWTNGTGVFVITSTKGEYHQLPTHYIVVPGSGATRITTAPLGPKVVTSAQHDGEFEFTSPTRDQGNDQPGRPHSHALLRRGNPRQRQAQPAVLRIGVAHLAKSRSPG